VVHADTIGSNGPRPEVQRPPRTRPGGHLSARFATGARLLIFTDDPYEFHTGTVMPLKASGTPSVMTSNPTAREWPHVEVRIDRKRPTGRTWSGWASRR
jgi:hypothetical protein